VAESGATRLSVVVVTYNSRAAVSRLLGPLLAELADGDELVVADNASADDTVAVVQALAPRASVLRMPRNLGFAAAANAGAETAGGELLVFLNPDVTPTPGFGDAIRAPLRDGRGWAAWMGLVTDRGGSLVNTSGGVVHFTGIAWAGEAGAPAPGSARGPREVAFVSGACLAIPREVWRQVGGFPPEFFMYHEDVDLSLRLRLVGGRIGIEPAAVVDHEYDFHKGPAKWRALERNRWATLVRCYPGRLLALLAPGLAATELGLLAAAAAGGWLPQKLAATGDTLRALPRLLWERRAIQATRAVAVGEFAAALSSDLDSAFLGRAGRSTLLRWALRAYWRTVLRALRAGGGRG
jgi:GT2 family glycosyltransferase